MIMSEKYRYFDIINTGSLFDYDGLNITAVAPAPGIDPRATHVERDKVLIETLRMYGEMLSNGMAEPRSLGRDMLEIAKEAEAIEAEVKFGYRE